MSADFYFPLSEPKGEVTHVAVSVSHSKDRKQVEVSAYPAIEKAGLFTLVITAGRYGSLDAMPRLNRKKVDELKKSAETQVKDRSGPAWDVVNKLCEDNGYKLA